MKGPKGVGKSVWIFAPGLGPPVIIYHRRDIEQPRGHMADCVSHVDIWQIGGLQYILSCILFLQCDFGIPPIEW